MAYLPSIRRPSTKKAKATHRGKPVEQGGIDTQFYRRATWRKLRESVLRQEPFCRTCQIERDELVMATVVDHITPINQGGQALDTDNLQPLCASCHAIKSAGERSGRVT